MIGRGKMLSGKMQFASIEHSVKADLMKWKGSESSLVLSPSYTEAVWWMKLENGESKDFDLRPTISTIQKREYVWRWVTWWNCSKFCRDDHSAKRQNFTEAIQTKIQEQRSRSFPTNIAMWVTDLLVEAIFQMWWLSPVYSASREGIRMI